MTETNPKANADDRSKPDEAWIRDLTAVDMQVEIGNHEAAARACEGFFCYCQYCGEKFALWPPKELMGHCQVDHARDLTLQQLNACAALCDAEWNVAHVQYFTAFVLTYVPLRRRLRDLGLVTFTGPKEMLSLVNSRGRRLQ